MVNCTFAQLREILLGLGYRHKDFDKATLFEHAEAHSRLLIDRVADDEPVDRADLAMVRYNLDMRGILPAARFEELLRERSLAG
jgi:hypothetical protein